MYVPPQQNSSINSPIQALQGQVYTPPVPKQPSLGYTAQSIYSPPQPTNLYQPQQQQLSSLQQIPGHFSGYVPPNPLQQQLYRPPTQLSTLQSTTLPTGQQQLYISPLPQQQQQQQLFLQSQGQAVYSPPQPVPARLFPSQPGRNSPVLPITLRPNLLPVGATGLPKEFEHPAVDKLAGEVSKNATRLDGNFSAMQALLKDVKLT
jgi:hypothetical protein